jgi:hypothetical protein
MVMEIGNAPRNGGVYNTIAAHDFLALNPGRIERPTVPTGWRIIQPNGLVLTLRAAMEDDIPPGIRPNCVGCLDLGYPDRIFERLEG